MKWRVITEEEVRSVIDQPEMVQQSIRGRMNAYGTTGGRYLKVTYREFDDRILIISVVDKSVERRTG
jgi:hypothetical protein